MSEIFFKVIRNFSQNCFKFCGLSRKSHIVNYAPGQACVGGRDGRGKVRAAVIAQSKAGQVADEGHNAKWEADVWEKEPRGLSGFGGDSTCDQRGKSSWHGGRVILCYHFLQIQVFIDSLEYCNLTENCKYYS